MPHVSASSLPPIIGTDIPWEGGVSIVVYKLGGDQKCTRSIIMGNAEHFRKLFSCYPLLFPAVTEASVAKAVAIDEGIASKISQELLQMEMLHIAMETCNICAHSDSLQEKNSI